MLCDKCNVEMGKIETDYHYRESGLQNVILNGIPAYQCPNCKEIHPIIPNIKKLHELIARALISKKSLLSGKEFVFLRKELKIKAADFAQMLNIHKVTVSRWENKKTISVMWDRLIRLLYRDKIFQLKCKTAKPEITKLKCTIGEISPIEDIISLCELTEINLQNIEKGTADVPISIPFPHSTGAGPLFQ
jgi:putative zinc finger/helix-turn-helix YgiT family protein